MQISPKVFMDKMPYLQWIDDQKDLALQLLKSWAEINSWSHNLAGLKTMTHELKKHFSPLGDKIEEVPLPPWEKKDERGLPYEVPLGSALVITRTLPSKKKILFGGHMDTVYPPSPDITCIQQAGKQLIGPGVADMKGGLIVLWLALSAFQKFRTHNLSWEIVINPDEEIGSPGSRELWEKKAKTADFGMLFEPCFPNGSLVSERKGGVSFTAVAKGQPAHAGRSYKEGRSAVKALCQFIEKAYALAEKHPNLTVNIADLFSDKPLNIIAEYASCKGNIRSFEESDLARYFNRLVQMAKRISRQQEVSITIYRDLYKTPKLFDDKTKSLYELLSKSAIKLGFSLSHCPSGGMSDGNILAACGLPTLDTLGVVGGALHTREEFMEIDSTAERAKLLCHFLLNFESA